MIWIPAFAGMSGVGRAAGEGLHPQDPAFFALDLSHQGLVSRFRRGEGLLQLTGVVHLGEGFGGGADLGLSLVFLDALGADLTLGVEQGGPDFDHESRQRLDVGLGQFTPAGVEGPDGGRGAQLVQQAAQHGHAQQGQAADSARAVHLPDALGRQLVLARGDFGGAELGDVGAGAFGRLGRGQPALRLAGGRAPEGPGLVRHQPVHLGRDLIAVVGVVGLVDDPRRRAGGEAEVEVEADQNAVAALAMLCQQVGDQGFALGARGDVVRLGIEAEAHVALGDADPQGLLAQLLAFGGGPVGDDVGVEETGHGGLLKTQPPDRGRPPRERGRWAFPCRAHRGGFRCPGSGPWPGARAGRGRCGCRCSSARRRPDSPRRCRCPWARRPVRGRPTDPAILWRSAPRGFPAGTGRRWSSPQAWPRRRASGCSCSRRTGPAALQRPAGPWRGRADAASRKACRGISLYRPGCRWADRWTPRALEPGPRPRPRYSGPVRLRRRRVGRAGYRTAGTSTGWRRRYRSSDRGSRRCSLGSRRPRAGISRPRI
uniref:PE-PGRS family protein n=1 Tax=Parastrongyloides trichosuri TaxID=131310 RepID=A0A0N5A025_PARTI